MTYRTDLARGREIIERWCLLAEQRLDYLTELYESGRWRRFHSETAFLDNIQEAKAAVETWRTLLTREALPDNTAVDNSWLARKPLPPRRIGLALEEIRPRLPRSLQIVVDRAEAEASDAKPLRATPVVAAPPVAEPAVPELVAELVPAGVERGWTPVPDLASIGERYPLLRNAL